MQKYREELLKRLREQGFPEEIISAFNKVKREAFVPDQFTTYAYEDIAIPLEDGSSLSQPSTIAFMLKLLEPKQGNKILEIGSGSGYALSLISEIIKSGKIYGLEINPRLAVKSKQILENDSNIEIINKSGLSGLPDNAPYDRIIVSASYPNKKYIDPLLDQLNDKGIIVAPVLNSILQVKKESGKIIASEFQGFAFVPFVI
jgi:protein-L-isoaspartate(D-aspartate) O-methyltransferase